MTSSTPSTFDPSPAMRVAFWLAVAFGFGLLAVGLGLLFLPAEATRAFGVPVVQNPPNPYVSVAGMRDLFAGCLALVFAALRDRRALGLTVLVGAIVPVGDGLITLRHNPSPLPFVCMHWGSVLGCVLIAYLLLRPTR